MLELEGVDVFYGDLQALRGVSLRVESGEIVTLVGGNGAGKTTMLRTVSGLLRPRRGEIRFEGRRLDRLPPDRIVEAGVVQVPEGRKLFPSLTVRENLELGAYTRRSRPARARTLEDVMARFPILRERAAQRAGSLSGGEQQMCVIARALMARPSLLMLDEPSLGLAPMVVQEIFRIIREINARGVTVLLVEQNVRQALATSRRGYVLENGRIVLSGTGQELLESEQTLKAYLGR
ncbi:MAG: ABC transporter-like protein, branched-chain amino acid transport system ATP-binding protein [Candidatus Rokubacteria bacterium CSP1-6]|nr:MAG: ABC transporter-like protein, branched-chain amino acid transport system ATP-binding protein [Candidatus Rokubacteria bacterium CSP1-6]